jgi:hypothetical protein
MNRYIVDGVPMTVVRRETTHSLLRSAGDRTRWVANELLECLCPADYEQLKSGQIALCVNAAVSERLRRGHAYFGAPPLVVVVGTPTADHSGQVSYNVLGFTDEQIEGFLKIGCAVVIQMSGGELPWRALSSFDVVLS